MFNYMNTKFILIICLLANSISLLLFTWTTLYYVLMLSRLLVGMFQVFFCIYFPVWVDIFIPEQKKTIMLTFLILGAPLGVIFGYLMTVVVAVYISVSCSWKYLTLFLQWEFSFYIQAITLIPLAIGFMMTPAKYIVYQPSTKK